MKREFSSGGIVVSKNKGSAFVLMIKDSYGRWSVPKGHIEMGESQEQAAVRETKEETGIEAEIIEKLGNAKYFFKLRGETIFKVVTFFLMKYKKGKTKKSWEVQEVAWVPATDAAMKCEYDNTRKMIAKAVRLARKVA